MKKLFNESAFEKRLPSGLFFSPGEGKAIGEGNNQVPQAEASRLKRFPGWVEREVEEGSAAPGAGNINASKGALKAAEDAGLDLGAIEIQGTGKDGQITKGDVDAYITAQKG